MVFGLAASLSAQSFSGLSFDGSDDFVTLDPRLAEQLSGKKQVTLEMRVTFDALKSFDALFSFGSSQGAKKSYVFELQTSGGGGNYLATNVSNGKEDFRVADQTRLEIGREYLISLVFDGTQREATERTRLYIDGARQQLTGGKNAPSVTADLDADTPIYIGREKNRYANITVSELRLWKTARTEQEIVANAVEQADNGVDADMIASYGFNKPYGETDPQALRTLEDAGGNAFPGTLSNFAFTGSSSNWVGMAAVLPVELIAFSATVTATENDLEWTVINERDLSHYTVERSTSGSGDWSPVATFLAKAGEQVSTYTYRYFDVAPVGSAYYRLRMVDIDGTFTLSEVRYVGRSSGDKLAVYPNPATDHFTLALPVGGAVSLQLSDASGRQLWSKQLPAGTTTITESTRDAAPGLYILTVRMNSTSWSQRLVIR